MTNERNQRELDELLKRKASECKQCNQSDPELRRNPANNGVAWQCRSCNGVLSPWISHSELRDINVLALPAWDRSTRVPGQTTLL